MEAKIINYEKRGVVYEAILLPGSGRTHTLVLYHAGEVHFLAFFEGEHDHLEYMSSPNPYIPFPDWKSSIRIIGEVYVEDNIFFDAIKISKLLPKRFELGRHFLELLKRAKK